MKKVILIAYILLGLVFVSLAQTKHTVGEKWGGGVVFVVVADGLHGLIAETQDQGKDTWDNAKALIRNSSNHSDAGKAFTDWRLPEKGELNLLYYQKDIVGGFASDLYWSSSELGSRYSYAWVQDFNDGRQDDDDKTFPTRVRAVRAF